MRDKITRGIMAPEGAEVISFSIKNISFDANIVKVDVTLDTRESNEPDNDTKLSAVLSALSAVEVPYIITKSRMASDACMKDISSVDRAFYALRRKGLVKAKYRPSSNDWLVYSVVPIPKAEPTLFAEEGSK